MNNKKELIEEYKKLAKRANKRLYNLEKLSEEDGFKVVKNWSYKRALYDIKQYGGNKRFKINLDKNININTLSAMRNDVYNFLNSPSSTKKGIIKMYKEKTKTFNNKYNTNWDWIDMANYFEKGGKEIFEEKFSSSTALDVLGVFRKNADDIKNIVDEFNNNHVINDDSLLNLKDDDNIINWKTIGAIKKLIKNGVDIDKFL